MNSRKHIQKFLFAALFVFTVQVVFAAFTSTISGHSNKKSATSKYSLKNISQYSNRGFSLNTVKYSLQIRPIELTSAQNGLVSSTNVQFTKGNTTYIFPYKVKVKVPKFKAPTLASH